MKIHKSKDYNEELDLLKEYMEGWIEAYAQRLRCIKNNVPYGQLITFDQWRKIRIAEKVRYGI